MAGHEPITHEHAVEPGSDRSFGFIVGGILAAIGGYQLFKASTLAPWFLTPGLLLVAFALVRPSALHPLNVAWTRLGLLLGRVVTPIVMLLVFVVAVLPTGLVVRAMGKDLLLLKRAPTKPSYWIRRDPPGPPPESLKDQF